jgi:nitrate reductase gamma subunit
MNNPDPFGEHRLIKLQLFIYLIPIFGTIPALWTLYRRQANREVQKVSRLVVSLALMWLLAYILLGIGATQTSEFLSLRLLFMNGLLTSGYFMICIALMIRLWQGKTPSLPGISRLAEGVGRKHQS